MRKSLLMTSALGLMMPTLAMAGAAAGSSAAVCGSGFFAQFDAKIMNAKLEIKNEKNTKVEADEETKVDTIINAAAADVLAQIGKADVEPLFNYGTEATKAQFVGDLLTLVQVENLRGKSPAEVAVEIGRVVQLANGAFGAVNAGAALPVVTDADKAATLRVAGRVLIAAAVTPVDAAGIFKNVVSDLTKLVNAVDPAIKVGSLQDALDKTFLVETRTGGTNADATADAVTAVSATFANKLYRKAMGDKFYLVNEGATAEVDPAFVSAFKQRLVGTALKVPAVLTALKASVGIAKFAETVAEDNATINAERAKREQYDVTDRRVHHHALAGGVGATVGWWQNLGGFALSGSISGDYHWGTFRTVDDVAGSTTKAEDKKKLGFGIQGDVGIHYVVSPSTTLGVLVGVRGQQLNFGRNNTAAQNSASTTDSKGDYASKWMINPTVSAQARTFFTDNVYGALTVGYIMPMPEKDFKLDNTKVDKDAKVRFQGLTGAFSVGMVF